MCPSTWIGHHCRSSATAQSFPQCPQQHALVPVRNDTIYTILREVTAQCYHAVDHGRTEAFVSRLFEIWR